MCHAVDFCSNRNSEKIRISIDYVFTPWWVFLHFTYIRSRKNVLAFILSIKLDHALSSESVEWNKMLWRTSSTSFLKHLNFETKALLRTQKDNDDGGYLLSSDVCWLDSESIPKSYFSFVGTFCKIVTSWIENSCRRKIPCTNICNITCIDDIYGKSFPTFQLLLAPFSKLRFSRLL